MRTSDPSRRRVGLLSFTAAFALIGGLAGDSLLGQQELRSCERAVSALLSRGGRLEAREENRGYGLENRSITWRTDDGSTGSCRIDRAGRVYSVEVERFGWGAGGGGSDWAAYSLTCESQDGRRRECVIRAGAWVRLEQQLSRGTCREGETWGWFGQRLWVDDGCRGVFRVEPDSGGSGGWGEENRARAARAACESKAALQGMQVLSASNPRRLDSQRWGVDLRVSLRGTRFEAGCNYNERTGYVEVYGR